MQVFGKARKGGQIRSLSKHVLAIGALAVLISGCSFQSKATQEADKITKAVIANNMDPVIKDFDSQLRAKITPITVAQYSTELRDQGSYKGIKEVPVGANSTPGEHDFVATFEKHNYTEKMILDDNGAVRSWSFHMQTAAPAAP